MLVTISSDNFTFSADSFGAELHSVRLDGREYLWQCGDAWKRYAPILFPFVCSPKDRAYRADGKDYKMNANHGFARDSEFALSEQTDSSVSFVLTQNETTLAQYPYDFEFTVRYSVCGKSSVKVENIVRNTGSRTMYFYIGGHPAFNCPLEEGLSFEDYYVEYSVPEKLSDPAGNVVLDGKNVYPVTRALFDNDALILDAPNSDSISLKSHSSDRSVTVHFPEAGCIAVWSPTGDDRAAFVCLEPWTSVPVYADDEYPDIEKKPHAISLERGGSYSFSYVIEVN